MEKKIISFERKNTHKGKCFVEKSKSMSVEKCGTKQFSRLVRKRSIFFDISFCSFKFTSEIFSPINYSCEGPKYENSFVK